MVLVVGLGDVVALIPMAALVAVMIMVSVGTFDWHSIAPATLRRMPPSETTVMVVTVAVIVATHNLAYRRRRRRARRDLFFARRVAHFTEVIAVADPDAGHTASTRSPASCSSPPATTSSTSSTTPTTPTDVVIDLSAAHIWDASTVAALDAIETKYASTARPSRSSA